MDLEDASLLMQDDLEQQRLDAEMLEEDTEEQVVEEEELIPPPLDPNIPAVSLGKYWRNFGYAFYVYCLISAIINIVGSIPSLNQLGDSNVYPCSRLQAWLLTNAVTQVVLVVSRLLLSKWKDSFAPRMLPGGSSLLKLCYKLSVISVQLLMMFFFSWQIVGLVWVIQSVPHCSSSLQFRLALVSLCGQMLLLVCASLVCCFSCVLTLARTFVGSIGGTVPEPAQRLRAGATQDEISAATDIIVYHEGMYEAEEDAKCVVCLSQYEDGDELRQLRCNHHFHVNCIDHWLQRKPTCPLCVQVIDG